MGACDNARTEQRWLQLIEFLLQTGQIFHDGDQTPVIGPWLQEAAGMGGVGGGWRECGGAAAAAAATADANPMAAS